MMSLSHSSSSFLVDLQESLSIDSDGNAAFQLLDKTYIFHKAIKHECHNKEVFQKGKTTSIWITFLFLK